MSEKYDSYYDELSSATLEVVEEGAAVKTFLLRKYPDQKVMSCYLIFSPAGIIITGDIRVCDHGVIAPGYDLGWFSQKLHPSYLAEKFLHKKWDPDTAKHAFLEWAYYLEEEINIERATAREEIEANGDEPTEEMIDGGVAKYYARHKWRVGPDEVFGTSADAIREFSKRGNFESCVSVYENLPDYLGENGRYTTWFDSEDVSRGYDYKESEIGWLTAIQRRFSECFSALQEGRP